MSIKPETKVMIRCKSTEINLEKGYAKDGDNCPGFEDALTVDMLYVGFSNWSGGFELICDDGAIRNMGGGLFEVVSMN